ncbi:hypothetical protein GL4_0854 [Methyloceanibacter caenitepidi]|uniref:Uncharacterized protein n=2 Tax=Methyloceanibacter caenitepidi TaxID=1384459 RepID=A0A0A8K064_9HYPH|nr:hypothetical protein GL4_0854 [Methyloceanibacter caenitepidi]
MYYTDDRIAASIAVKDGQESSEIDDGREPKNKPQPKAA